MQDLTKVRLFTWILYVLHCTNVLAKFRHFTQFSSCRHSICTQNERFCHHFGYSSVRSPKDDCHRPVHWLVEQLSQLHTNTMVNSSNKTVEFQSILMGCILKCSLFVYTGHFMGRRYTLKVYLRLCSYIRPESIEICKCLGYILICLQLIFLLSLLVVYVTIFARQNHAYLEANCSFSCS